MLRNSLKLRIVIGAAAIAALLFPGLIFAYAWGATLNLEVAIAATAATIAVAAWLPKIRWPVAALSSLVIAIPPYPYWTDWDDKRGQYLHFFHGYSWQDVPILMFTSILIAALLLYGVIFWAVGKRARPS